LYLGRPWRAYAKTIFINCSLPPQIIASGWHNWDNPSNEKTVFYAEYSNKGAGARSAERVTWSRQLSGDEAKEYTIGNIFGNGNASIAGSAWYNMQVKPFNWSER
jgi:pectinesterase